VPEGFESGLFPEGTAAYFMATTATNTTHLTPTLRWRHTAVVAAARLQASPPALQEWG